MTHRPSSQNIRQKIIFPLFTQPTENHFPLAPPLSSPFSVSCHLIPTGTCPNVKPPNSKRSKIAVGYIPSTSRLLLLQMWQNPSLSHVPHHLSTSADRYHTYWKPTNGSVIVHLNSVSYCDIYIWIYSSWAAKIMRNGNRKGFTGHLSLRASSVYK